MLRTIMVSLPAIKRAELSKAQMFSGETVMRPSSQWTWQSVNSGST